MRSNLTSHRLFGAELEPSLPWSGAEDACRLMGSDTHLASLTSLEQQHAVTHLAEGSSTWIGLNDQAEAHVSAWTDGEPVDYTFWTAGQKDNYDQGDAVVLSPNGSWDDKAETDTYPYICAKQATPIAASGGDMNGCTEGHWVMGTTYKHVESMSLPPTIVRRLSHSPAAAQRLSLSAFISTGSYYCFCDRQSSTRLRVGVRRVQARYLRSNRAY